MFMSFLNGISAIPALCVESDFWASSSTVVGTDDEDGLELDESSRSARTKAARCSGVQSLGLGMVLVSFLG